MGPPRSSGLSESLAPVVTSELTGWLILGVASKLAHPRSCQCPLGQRDFEVGRHRVSTCVGLLQLRQDVLVVLAVDVDLVAIILLNGKGLPAWSFIQASDRPCFRSFALRATYLALASGRRHRRFSPCVLRLLTFTRSCLELFLLPGNVQSLVGLVIGRPGHLRPAR